MASVRLTKGNKEIIIEFMEKYAEKILKHSIDARDEMKEKLDVSMLKEYHKQFPEKDLDVLKKYCLTTSKVSIHLICSNGRYLPSYDLNKPTIIGRFAVNDRDRMIIKFDSKLYKQLDNYIEYNKNITQKIEDCIESMKRILNGRSINTFDNAVLALPFLEELRPQFSQEKNALVALHKDDINFLNNLKDNVKVA